MGISNINLISLTWFVYISLIWCSLWAPTKFNWLNWLSFYFYPNRTQIMADLAGFIHRAVWANQLSATLMWRPSPAQLNQAQPGPTQQQISLHLSPTLYSKPTVIFMFPSPFSFLSLHLYSRVKDWKPIYPRTYRIFSFYLKFFLKIILIIYLLNFWLKIILKTYCKYIKISLRFF